MKPAPTEEIAQPIDDRDVNAIIKHHIRHTPVGLIYDENAKKEKDKITFEEWMQAHQFYGALRERTNWMIGDSLRKGEEFGERYAQAVDLHGKEYSTLVNIVSVCTRFHDIARRRPGLSFRAHADVAYLPPQEADHILDQAERHHWTSDRIRDAAAISQGKPTKAQRDAAKIGKTPKAKSTARGANEPATIDVQATVTKGGDAPCAPQLNEDPAPAAQTPKASDSTCRTAPPTDVSNAAQPSNPTAAAKPTEQPQERAEDALTNAEARLHQFVAAIPAMNAASLKPLQRKRWLTMLIPIDELIDVLQKP